MRLAPLLTLVPLLACAAPLGPYKVEIDVYVRDERRLCEQAHKAAIERFGAGVAEIMTRTYGEWDVTKCLAVLYQTTEHSDQIVSFGIDVRKQ